MSPTGDNAPFTLPPSNLNFLYQRHRSRVQDYQGFHSRTQSLPQHDQERREAYGEKLTRIYPRELRKSPPAATRHPPPTSPYPITSPLLSALGSTTNTAAQYTSDWTKSLPFFSSPQPGSIAGSPPTPIPVQGGRDAISASPPSMKPRSHPNNNAFPSLSPLSQNMVPPRDRRSSMYSQYGNGVPYRGRAPLPHEDQPHFHAGGLPDFDSIGMPPKVLNSGLRAGEKDYLCCWDTLGAAGHTPSASAENVLLVGSEGGLDVWRIDKKKLDRIGHLSGLKGAVIGGKILPWFDRSDPGAEGRPYVALIIHGPVLEEPIEAQNSSDDSPAISLDEGSPEPSTRPSSSKGPTIEKVIKGYVTSVEVYSLFNQKHIATLYTSPVVNADIPVMGEEFKVPPPIGDLRVDANGRFIVVASGESGEIFIFSPYIKRKPTKNLDQIRCIGKLWTTVRRPEVNKGSSGTGNPDQSNLSDNSDTQRGVPLFTLSNRWIATIPPSSSSSFPLNGIALLPESSRKPPGMSAHMAPLQPTTTCSVDTPEGNDLMNRMSRELTQNAIRGGKWLFDQGLGAWNSYMSKPADGAYRPAEPTQPNQHFPPTHGYNTSLPTTNEPTKVSIFDMQRFLDAEDVKVKNVLMPLATFELSSGCSFLSFAPGGLHMLTVSRKGDEQFVWQLLKMRDPRSSISSSQIPSGPYVRQIEKIVRMTPAKIVDVAWSAPHGEKLAIFTENGTVHVHEIHPSKFQWPPSRRARKFRGVQRTQSEETKSSRGRLGSALETVSGASTWLKNARERSLSGQVTFGNLAMTPANLSRKAVKAGIKQGASAVANAAIKIYHDGDNKLRLQSKIDVARPDTIRWMTGKLQGYFAVAAAGTIATYPVRSKASSGKGRSPQMHVKISAKGGVPFDLPPITADKFAPAVVTTVQARVDGLSAVIPPPTGSWTLRAPHSLTRNKRHEKENWHAMVEAETNPPYQPFHTDRRVTLLAFAEPDTPSPVLPYKDSSPEEFNQYDSDRHDYTRDILIPHARTIHHIDDDSPWLFGEDIKGVRTLREGNSRTDDFDLQDEEMENQVEAQEGKLVMTTIRRKTRDDEEFFEDDAEIVDFADNRV